MTVRTSRRRTSCAFRPAVALVLAVSMLAAGCKPQEPREGGSAGRLAAGAEAQPTAQSVATTVATTNPVPLSIKSWDEVEATLKGTSGRLVVLDVWMTTCETCQAEYPAFLKFAKDYADRGVTCISINTDFDGIFGKPPEYYRARVEKFLAKQDSQVENVLLSLSCLEFINLHDINSSPAFLIYSTDGRKLEKLDGDSVAGGTEPLTMEYVAGVVDRHLRDLSAAR